MSSSSPTTLSQLQFEVFTSPCCTQINPLTQRELHQLTDISPGVAVNSTVRQCEAAGYISERALTEAGRQALAPIRWITPSLWRQAYPSVLPHLL